MMDLTHRTILLTGAGGFLGGAVRRALLARGVPREIIVTPRSAEYDLRGPQVCKRLLQDVFDGREGGVIIHCAATSGGVGFHRDQPSDALLDNVMMATSLVKGAQEVGLSEQGATIVGVGSMCAYPASCVQPLEEETLWDGYPAQPTAPYGVAKRLLWQALDSAHRQYGLRSSFVSLTNLYGPGARFDPDRSNVVAAMIDRVLQASRDNASHITCWGSGSPTRDFLFVDDAAEAVVRAAERVEHPDPINIGAGVETSIRELVETIRDDVGWSGDIRWDASKPDGAPRVLVDTTRARDLLEWTPSISLSDGLKRTIAWRRSTLEATEPAEHDVS